MKDIVLVTGSSGLLGTAVTQRLAPEFDVIGLDTHSSPRPRLQRDSVFIDLESEDSVRTALGYVHAKYGTKLASVVHLAAYCDFSGEPSPLYESVTVKGTERLLTALGEFKLEQFVFSSTMLVHAPGAPGVPVHEDSPLLPRWDYPRAKSAAEKVIHARRGRTPAAILRIAGAYDDLCHSVPIANQMRRIFERKLIGHVFPGDTSHGQACVHVDDIAEAVALCVTRRAKLPAETPILIGEPESPSYDELQRTLGELIHGEAWETRQIPKALAEAGDWLEDAVPGEEPFIKPWMVELADDHYELDITRARLLLGWQPLRSLRSSLPRMADALKADPQRFYRENQLETPEAPESHDGRAAERQPQALSHAR